MQSFKNENDQILADAEAAYARLQQKGRDIANPPKPQKPSALTLEDLVKGRGRQHINYYGRPYNAPSLQPRLDPAELARVLAPSAPVVPPALRQQAAKNVASAATPTIEKALPPGVA